VIENEHELYSEYDGLLKGILPQQWRRHCTVYWNFGYWSGIFDSSVSNF